jgi:hypothetical protein
MACLGPGPDLCLWWRQTAQGGGTTAHDTAHSSNRCLTTSDQYPRATRGDQYASTTHQYPAACAANCNPRAPHTHRDPGAHRTPTPGDHL